MERTQRKGDPLANEMQDARIKINENNEQENYNSKREDLEEEDQREDERNVIL